MSRGKQRGLGVEEGERVEGRGAEPRLDRGGLLGRGAGRSYEL